MNNPGSWTYMYAPLKHAKHEFSFAAWRFPGVLQRIGICYFIAASLFLAGGYRLTLASGIILIAVYGLFVEFFPVPGFGAGILSPDGVTLCLPGTAMVSFLKVIPVISSNRYHL